MKPIEFFSDMKRIFASLVRGVAFSFPLFLAACGDDTTTEKIVEVASGTEIVSSIKDLPKCTADNEGEQAFVKGETSARICVDGKWFAMKETVSDTVYMQGGEDTVVVAVDTVYMRGDFSCTTEELEDKSGIKIVCNGDSVGVVPNGATGSDGADCTVAQDGSELTITCGEKSTKVNLDEDDGGIVVDTASLDSEKVAVSLDEVSGASQKGPFLSGSKVLVKELEDGRSLTQTGNNFDGKILNDKGEFNIAAHMLVSQYVMLEATGYYRDEITGGVSPSTLTLFGITDVTTRNVVNINLLTHLEYERVIYLVTKKKMTVMQAKRQAQQEVFGLLDINAEGFSNSEDLNIAGSSDEDGALLAFSVMFQGGRSVGQLTELLTRIATDMEKDGSWDDDATRLSIADWSADADLSGLLETIRNNVASWGLSAMVPNFEQFVRHFWTTEYGLDSCTANNVGLVMAATAGKREGTETRYICKDVDGLGGMRWLIASDSEKDTYGWDAGDDGEVKKGSVTGTKYYLYDATTEEWREASIAEQKLGGCIESVAADMNKNTGFVNGFWYKCEDRVWAKTESVIVDTQGWIPGSDGDVQMGDSTGAYYVFDLAENQWRDASDNDVNFGVMGCTKNRAGEIGRSSVDNRYYRCELNHEWTLIKDKAVYNTVGYDCDEEGKMVAGIVNTKSHFVCDAGVWREATTIEEKAGEACTVGMKGQLNKDSTKVCVDNDFRDADLYDFDVGVKDYFNPEIEYDTLVDSRDGRVYKTVTINGMTVMAENLNYVAKAYGYQIDNNWCYGHDTTNCLKGGRYYTWTAAMDIDDKWQFAVVPAGTIKTPHQGICPDGWHLPTRWEWEALFADIDAVAQQALGNAGWKNATNTSGFSALPIGGYFYGDFHENGTIAYFWSASEDNENYAFCWYLSAGGGVSVRDKDIGVSVRCIQDTPVEP